MGIKKYIQNIVLSTPENGYRPYVLRPLGLLFLSLLIIGLKVSLSNDVFLKTQLVQVKKEITSENIYKLTNDERIKNNVAALSYSSLLQEAALKKAQHMLDNDYWAHESPDGVTPWHWFAAVGYDYEEAGENLAVDFITSDGVMNGWMNSPTHRANILEKKYTEVGVGVLEGEFQGKISTLVVQLFGTPKAKLASNNITSQVRLDTRKGYDDNSSQTMRSAITTASPTPGTFKNSVVVRLSTNIPADIYYTLGTDMPTTNDKKYDSPIVLTESTYISYFSVTESDISENTQRSYYEIEGSTPTQLPDSSITAVITSPKNRDILNSDMVTITGNATPLSNVDLYINDTFIRSKEVNTSGRFQMKEHLVLEGKNEIKIIAGDKESKVFVILDKEKPQFSMQENYDVAETDTFYEATITVTAETPDIVSISGITENENLFETTDNKTFTGKIQIAKDSDKPIFTIRATDIAGNHAEEVIDLVLPKDTSSKQIASVDADTTNNNINKNDEIVTGFSNQKANKANEFSIGSVKLGIFKWVIAGVILFLMLVIVINIKRNEQFDLPNSFQHAGLFLSMLTILTIGIILFL